MSAVRNIDTLFFMLVWDRYIFQKKRTRTRYAKLVFWHPVGSAGQVGHCGGSGVQNIDLLFFLLLWDRYEFHKNASGHPISNLCFCIRWYLQVT
jgi:hypothetical protein